MIYLSLGEAVRQGDTLYLDIHDNKPPLLYLTAALSGSLVVFRVILAFWMLVTTVVFWKFATAFSPKKERLHQISTIVFGILTTIPLLEGNIANAELFMIGPTILAFLLLIDKKLEAKKVFLAGSLLSVSTLFKVPAAFDIPAIIFLWLVVGGLNLKNIKKLAKNTLILASGYLLPIAVTFVWYQAKGALGQYVFAAYLQNVGYLSSFRPDDVREPFLVRNLPLLIRAAITGIGLTTLFAFRKKLSKQFIFLCAWLLLSLFAVTLSERPYPHYLVQSVPAISLLVGILFSQKSLEQSLTVFPLGLALFVPHYFGFWHYPTGVYYQRFSQFMLGQVSRAEYFASFDKKVDRNYAVAKFIADTTRRTDPVFVWGDSSTIYALSRRLPPIRYVADYHIKDFSSHEEVLKSLETTPPELIVVLPDSPAFQELSEFMGTKYIQVEELHGAEIWTRIRSEDRK